MAQGQHKGAGDAGATQRVEREAGVLEDDLKHHATSKLLDDLHTFQKEHPGEADRALKKATQLAKTDGLPDLKVSYTEDGKVQEIKDKGATIFDRDKDLKVGAAAPAERPKAPAEAPKPQPEKSHEQPKAEKAESRVDYSHYNRKDWANALLNAPYLADIITLSGGKGKITPEGVSAYVRSHPGAPGIGALKYLSEHWNDKFGPIASLTSTDGKVAAVTGVFHKNKNDGSAGNVIKVTELEKAAQGH